MSKCSAPVRPTSSQISGLMLSKGIFKQISVFHSLSARIGRVHQGARHLFFSKSPGISCLSSERILIVSPSLIWTGRKWGDVQTSNFERQIRKTRLGHRAYVVHSSRLNGIHCTQGVRRKLFVGNFYSEEHSLTYIGAEPARDVSLFPCQLRAPELDFDSIPHDNDDRRSYDLQSNSPVSSHSHTSTDNTIRIVSLDREHDPKTAC